MLRLCFKLTSGSARRIARRQSILFKLQRQPQLLERIIDGVKRILLVPSEVSIGMLQFGLGRFQGVDRRDNLRVIRCFRCCWFACPGLSVLCRGPGREESQDA